VELAVVDRKAFSTTTGGLETCSPEKSLAARPAATNWNVHEALLASSSVGTETVQDMDVEVFTFTLPV
jgi:hypothetical protein